MSFRGSGSSRSPSGGRGGGRSRGRPLQRGGAASTRGARSPSSSSSAAAPAGSTNGFGHGMKMARLSHPHAPSKPATKPAVRSTPAPPPPPPTAAPVSSVIAVDDDSDHFIRGRIPSAHSAVKAERAPAARETDSLFGAKAAALPAKKRRKAADEVEEKAAPVVKKRRTSSTVTAGGSVTSSASSHLDVLTYRHMYVGQLLLGSVRTVSELELLLALPNGHSGHLALREISTTFQQLVDAFILTTNTSSATGKKKKGRRTQLPDLQSLFHVGQLLPVSVLALTTPEGAKRIELSMRVEVVNAQLTAKGLSEGMRLLCSVSSVQERGYTVDIGVSDAQMTGFLPFAEAPVDDINQRPAQGKGKRKGKTAVEEKTADDGEGEEEKEEERLVIGQPLICLVRSVAGRAVTLTARPSLLRSHVSTASASQHLQSLLPSSLFALTVSSVTPQGLLCSTPTFNASIDLTHLPSLPSSSTNLSLLYRPNSTLTAMLLYANKASRTCAFTLNPALLDLGRSTPSPAHVGEWVSAQVHRVEEKLGVYFHSSAIDRTTASTLFSSSSPPLPPSTPTFTSFAPLSRLSDDVVEPATLLRPFRPNSLHLARVSAYDPLSSLAHLTLLPSTLSLPILSLDDLYPGQLVTGSLSSFEPFGLLIQLSPHIRGLVLPLHYADIPLSDPRKAYKLGQQVHARVLHVDPRTRHVLLTCKRTLVKSAYPVLTSVGDARVDEVVHGWVAAADVWGVMVETYNRLKGLVAVKTLVREGYVREGAEEEVAQMWRKGDVLAVRVATVDQNKRKLFFSLKLKRELSEVKGEEGGKEGEGEKAEGTETPSADGDGDKKEKRWVVDKQVKVGAVVNGRVTRVLKGSGLIVAMAAEQTGRVHVCDVSDEWASDVAALHKVGERIKARVAAIKADEAGKKQIDLIMKQSAVAQPDQPLEEKALSDFEVDSVVRGYVKHTDSKGCFVWLTRDVVGRVLIKDLSDGHVSFPAEAFPAGKLVKARILSIDAASSHVNLSLRPSVVSPRPLLTVTSLSVGQKVKGEVRNVKPFGVFVRLRHSQVDGLAHISECSEERIEDLSQHYKVGDRVRAVVLRKDDDKKQLSLGLKAKYFEDETEEENKAASLDSDDDGDIDEDHTSNARASSTANGAHKEEEVKEQDGDTAMEAEEMKAAVPPAGQGQKQRKRKGVEEAKEQVKQPASKRAAPASSVDDDFDEAAPLQVDLSTTAGLTSATAEEAADGDAAAASSSAASGPLTRRAKAAVKREAQLALEARELALTNPTAVPKLPADFERLLLASPNSSYLWTQFMAHHIAHSQLDDARKVARRALETIAPREEAEKLNVWVALVGLELQFAGEKEALAVVAEASQRCEEEALHVELSRLYQSSGHPQLCIDAYRALTKAHPEKKVHWVSFARFLFSQGQMDEGRALLSTAIARLRSVRDEVELVEHFALLEFAHGSVERGRTMLEAALKEHPKRADVWNVWVDAELKLMRGERKGEGGMAHIRRVLDGAIGVHWSSKKMKHLLKRYLEVEKEFGDERRVEYVKQKAREYVDKKMDGHDA